METSQTQNPPLYRWGISGDTVVLRGGHRNRVLRISGPQGAYVCKTTRRSEAAMRWLGPVHDLARSLGFRVPEVLEAKCGNLICDGWTCEAFVEGRPTKPHDLTALTGSFHAFHRNAVHLPQRPGSVSARDLLSQSSGGDIDLNAMPEDLVELCRAGWSGLRDKPQTIVHGDLNTSNILIDADGQPVVLDWDECRRDAALFDEEPLARPKGQPPTDPAVLAWEIANAWTIEPDYARRLETRLRQWSG